MNLSMTRHSVQRALITAALASACAMAVADEAMPLPPAKQSGDVTYTSGGVPDEQLPAVKAARGAYPLVIELFQREGQKNQYTSNVQVRLIDAQGKVLLDDTSEGPFFLVKTAPGTYKVEATLDGKTLTQQAIKVDASGSRRVVFVFPAS